MQAGFEAAGDVATGTLIGHAFDTGGHAAHGEAHGHGRCLNCQATLQGDFCHACGQAAHLHRTLWSIVHDVLHGVYHFEGKIWTTLPLLFTKPGSLTRRYIAGERVKFVSPLALFLFSVFLMVATFETVGGIVSPGVSDKEVNGHIGEPLPNLRKKLATEQARLAATRAEQKTLEQQVERLDSTGQDSRTVEARAEALDRQGDKIEEEIDGLKTAINLVGGGDFEQGFKDGMSKGNLQIHTGSSDLDKRIKKAAENPKLFFYKLQSSAYKYSWMLVPISLPFIWLLFFWRRDVGPYDHAIFAIYSLSAMTLGVVALSLLAAVGVPGPVIATAVVLGPPLHIYKQLRGAYRIGRFSAAWRTVALLLSALIASSLFFVAILNVIA
ncbi:MAG: hypothetical protein A4S12_04120 [Proteobacteria bacterium SG_bin5]|nr:DUF3667 domain-containing protein [Sphingomonas sp.]OQW43711.1 MAG: hypothetical protein A4S12_04120 [Proteobacteria bacterium SG_bin5]